MIWMLMEDSSIEKATDLRGVDVFSVEETSLGVENDQKVLENGMHLELQRLNQGLLDLTLKGESSMKKEHDTHPPESCTLLSLPDLQMLERLEGIRSFLCVKRNQERVQRGAIHARSRSRGSRSTG